jgi:hypothetical protein
VSDPTVTETETGIVVEYSGDPIPPDKIKKERIKELKIIIDSRLDILKTQPPYNPNDTPETKIRRADEFYQATKEWADATIELAELSMEDQAKRAEVIRKTQNILKENEALKNQAFAIAYASSAKNEPNIKVSGVSAVETERSYGYVTYSIKADVDNKGNPGEVYIKIVGKNFGGHEMDFVYLKGTIDRRESKTLTNTTMVTYQKAMDIRTWEIDSVKIYNK